MTNWVRKIMDRSKQTIEASIDALPLADLQQLLQQLEATFGCRGVFSVKPEDLLQQALTCFELSQPSFCEMRANELQEHVELQQTQANRIHLRARDVNRTMEGRARKLAQDVRTYGQTLLVCKKALQNAATVLPDLDCSMDTEADEEPAKWTKSFKIINYILDICRENRYFKRKYACGTIYMQSLTTDDGTQTCFYEQLGSVADLVQRFTQEQTNFKMFKLCTDEPRTFDHVVKMLSDRLTSRFPFLVPDR